MAPEWDVALEGGEGGEEVNGTGNIIEHDYVAITTVFSHPTAG